MNILNVLTEELHLKQEQVENTVKLIDEGNTIPFIARYRKELTGSLDDTTLRTLFDRLNYLRNLEKRKEEVFASISEQGNMTEDISDALNSAVTLTEVEDIYRPYKPKRKTRASVAREKGLLPLSELIMEQKDRYEPSIVKIAEDFINEEKGVMTAADALNGACDIIAETISDDADFRKAIRALTHDYSTLESRCIKNDDSPYSMYYDYSEKFSEIPPHRILAVNRAENEGYVKISINIEPEIPLNFLNLEVLKNPASPAAGYVLHAIADGYDRLIAPSVERELFNEAFDNASEGAIKLFSQNLRNLLLGAPLKDKTVLGLDPGYRTGCKLAVVDKTGKVLDTSVIYPTKPHEKTAESASTVLKIIDKYNVDVVSIGNGTASKESEIFIADTIKKCTHEVKYTMVSEAGASVYSASKLGAEEFPDYDVTQRSAVSIARRLQDPLAELVKIEPRSIGVGQYQHDMKQARLGEALGGVVEDCVNSVGIDLNTASYSLLSYVSGINISSAKSIVKYREENGEFKTRAEILKVPRIGEKAYEQCAGFMRVPGSKEILDNTGVHPESYSAAKKLISEFGYNEEDVRSGKLNGLYSKSKNYGFDALCEKLNIGKPTLLDILRELEKPGRDLRDDLPAPQLRTDILDMSDLVPGMELSGIVRNVIDFGAFIDIGVHQDGLVHISQISDKYIKHPTDALAVGDKVRVKVLSVDTAKKRISLTMKGLTQF